MVMIMMTIDNDDHYHNIEDIVEDGESTMERKMTGEPPEVRSDKRKPKWQQWQQ